MPEKSEREKEGLENGRRRGAKDNMIAEMGPTGETVLTHRDTW